MPFEEIPHTADWALRVRASDLAGLMVESARGMAALAGMQTIPSKGSTRHLNLEATDAEALLVAFLSELVYLAEQEGLGFEALKIGKLEEQETFRMEADMEVAPIQEVNKVIKAVTYHNLQIRPTDHGLEVEIVFDV